LIYSGQKHRRIAAKIEERLISTSLRSAGAAGKADTTWQRIISLSEGDSRLLEFTRINGLRDISIKEYGAVLGKLLSGRPDRIYMAWNPGSHDKAESYEPLNVALRRTSPDKVVLVVRYDQTAFVPDETQKLVTIADSDDCMGTVQNVCTFDATWTDWIPQVLANQYLDKSIAADVAGVISENLPRSQPSYLIYLQRLDDFATQDFSSILRQPEINLRGQTVFLGNGLFQDGKAPSVLRREIGRVETPISARVDDNRVSGVPNHVFWAQLAQMFKNGQKIWIVPESVTWGIAGLLALVVLLVLLMIGAGTVLGIFTVAVLAAPYLNAQMIHFFHIYVPSFDIEFGVLQSLLIGTFAKLSLNAYAQWISHMQREEAESSRDLKGNFLSLISHNLNTPVAKMQGMLDLLSGSSKNSSLNVAVEESRKLVATIQLAIRCVLATNSLREGNIQVAPVTVHGIRDEFDSQIRGILTRLAIRTDFSFAESTEELQYLPLSYDRRMTATLLGAAASLFQGDAESRLRLEADIRDGDNPSFQFRMIGPVTATAVSIASCQRLAHYDGRRVAEPGFAPGQGGVLGGFLAQELPGDDVHFEKARETVRRLDLLRDLALRVMLAMADTHKGMITITQSGNEANILLDFPPILAP
jgi:signal transduction histidine kinase